MSEVLALTRLCRICQQYKSAGDFYAHDKGRCRLCTIVANKQYYEENREKRSKAKRDYYAKIQPSGLTKLKEERLWRNYGFSPGQFKNVLKMQGYKCASCGGQFDLSLKRPHHIDHDHVTGKVRGILCHGCNLILGHAKDNIETLQKAIRYLRRYK